jgi:biotin carboxyl carrier protein
MATMDIPSPMAGSLKMVMVSVGDRVSLDQELLIIESMKMEIPLESPVAGTVAEIVVDAPARIDEGQVLLRIEV